MNEQRQFQQEIADRSLREQQQRALGLAQTQTTSPNPTNQFAFQSNFFSNQPDDLSNPNNQFDFQTNTLMNQQADSPDTEGQFTFQSDRLQDQRTPAETYQSFGTQLSSYSPQSPQQSFSVVRTYRSRRAIDRQFQSNNDLSFFPSTVRPHVYVENFLHERSNPRSDLAKIGSWLIGNLAKQLEKNLAHLTESTAKPKVHFPIPNRISINPSSNFIPTYLPPVKIENRTPWKMIQSTPEPSANSLPWNQLETVSYADLAKHTWNFPTTTLSPNPPSPLTVTPQMSPPPEYHRIRNVQVLPTSNHIENPTMNPYDNSIFQAYQQIYNIDHQTNKPVESTTVFLSSMNDPPTTDVNVNSLFKTKLNAFKRTEAPKASLQPGYSEFQQPNRFFDLLQQQNSTIGAVTENSSLLLQPTETNLNPGSAIFIRIPDEEPTSTVGYIFDKTISAKTQHKKESYVPKKSNRSAQIIKSSLVYRTPPGKRATVSQAELVKHSQMESGMLSNFLEPGRPVFRLLGQTKPTTTTRPLVTALWNLVQRRL